MNEKQRIDLLVKLAGWKPSPYRINDSCLFSHGLCFICFRENIRGGAMKPHLNGHLKKLGQEKLASFEAFCAFRTSEEYDLLMKEFFGFDTGSDVESGEFWGSK